MNDQKIQFVLLRGLMRECRHWGDFPRLLQQAFPDADIHTLDIPGNGRFFRQTSPASIGAMTDALRAQIDSSQKIHLLALSMGGMIALDWSQRYPEQVGAMVLINTSLRALSPFYQRLRWQAYPQIFKLLWRPPEIQEKMILALCSNRFSNDQALLRQWRQWRLQCPVSRQSAINQLLAAARFSIRQAPSVPMLVVYSHLDRLVDCRCSQAICRRWLSDYREHHSAGHDLPLDEPQWLATVVQQWFEQQTLINE